MFFVFSLSLLTSTSCAQQTSGTWVNSTASSFSHTASPPPAALLPSVINSIEQLFWPNVESKSSNVGDSIAAGIGMTRSTNTTMGDAPLSNMLSNTTKLEGSTPVSALSSTPIITTPPTAIPSRTLDQEETITVTTNLTISRITQITILPTSGNYTISFSGDCLDQWNSYWSANLSVSKWFETTYSETYTESEWSLTLSTTRFSGTQTVTVKYGAFAQSTYTTLAETSESVVLLGSSLTNTYLTTALRDTASTSYLLGNATIVQPTCTLPTYVPECQSSWEAYLSVTYAAPVRTAPAGCGNYTYADTRIQSSSCEARLSAYSAAQLSRSWVLDHNDAASPFCTQASITGALCSSIVGDFPETVKNKNSQRDGVVDLIIVTTYTTREESNDRSATITTDFWSWDPLSSLAPGCSLGCQSCQVNGGTVQLIFWLPMSSTWIDGTYSAISGNSNETVNSPHARHDSDQSDCLHLFRFAVCSR